MRTKEITLYKFDELPSDQAKERARDWYRSGNDGAFEWESIQEDAKETGLIISSLSDHRANSGRFDKYAEDTAQRIMKNHGDKCETYQTAKNFLSALQALKRDEDGELYIQEQDKANELEEGFLDDLLEDYRIMLNKEIEYQNSDEQVDESIRANEYEFDKNGEIA